MTQQNSAVTTTSKTLNTPDTILFWCILSVMITLAAFIQNALFLHGDVGYLISVTQSLLNGGTYGIDFFETNPPMILYLYIPPLWLSQVSTLSIETSFRIYLFLLIAVSMQLSFTLLRKIIHDKFLLHFLMISLLYILAFLPCNQFGQKEHLLLILMLPYIFASVCALTQKCVRPALAIIIGLLAGIGFSMKPFFLFPLILIELYFIYKKRHFLAWVRIETMAILAILSIYLISTYLFYPTYFGIMMPLIRQYYFPGVVEPWSYMISVPIVIYSLAACSIFWLARKHTRYAELITILALATLGTILAFVVTKTTWFYHTIPAFGLACLVFACVLAECITPRSIKTIVIFSLTGCILFQLPLANTIINTRYHLQQVHDSGEQQLITFFTAQSGTHSIMCFSANTTGDCFPLVNHSHSLHASRYPFFWWLRGVLKAPAMTTAATQTATNFFINRLAEDLTHYQTRWIVINKNAEKDALGENFDYITYFSKNANFQQAWKPYHYLTTIRYYDIYQRS